MIAGSQTIADDRRRSQKIEHGSIFCDRLRSRSQDRRRSQTIAEVGFHMIADDRRTFCDLRSAIRDRLRSYGNQPLLASVLADIHDAPEKMSDSNGSSDVVEELNFIEGQAKQNIWVWKAHLLRCVNQDETRLEAGIIEALNESSVLLVQDWAMTFLPKTFRESQID